MLSLFDFLDKNHPPALQFIDADTGNTFRWEELSLALPPLKNGEKKLAFLYLDNSIDAIAVLVSFLKTHHLIALLNAQLDSELKKALEYHYMPDFIADPEGRTITGAERLVQRGKFIVHYKEREPKNIHPGLKILLSTSGTTGTPKFVKLSDQNFISNTTSIVDYLPVDTCDSCILNLPVSYSYGLSVLLTNIHKGGRIICSNETVLSKKFWELFTQHSCTSIAGVPYTYEMLSRIGFTKMPAKNLRYMTQAGGKINEKILGQFSAFCKERNIPFYVMYGQTEATARMSYLHPEDLQNKAGSIGKPIKDGRFRIEETTGELIYSGPNIGHGYAENTEDLEKAERMPELHTGDMARVDADGFYYITGRLKRFIKLFGNRINPDEIEVDLREKYGGVIGCTGINDQLLLVFSTNDRIVETEIKNYISEKYKIHISVIKYRRVENIPVTSNQKINYQEIINSYHSS